MNTNSLGQFIRDARINQDFSLREFAKQIDCSAAFLSDVELGRRYLPEDFFGKVAKLLKISEEDLKQRDTRLPTDGLKALAQEDPRYAFAFRTMVEKRVSAEELLAFAKKCQEEGVRSKRK